LPGGGILVVNGGNSEVWIFDSGGVVTKGVGGRGEGPGEFFDPVLIPSLGADSLMFFDKGLPRYQVFTVDGQAVRTIRHINGWPNGRRPPLGVVDGRVLFESREIVGGEVALNQQGLQQLQSTFFWHEPGKGTKEVFGDPSLVDWAFEDRRGTTWSVPFHVFPAAAVAQGSVFISESSRAQISEYDLHGKLLRILRLDGVRRPVTGDIIVDMIDLELAGSSGRTRDEWERAYSGMPLPDSLPAFRSILVDELGFLWAEAYDPDPDNPSDWIVFDSDGRARGTVKTPPGVSVKWIGHASILGVHTDEFDVETVHRYGLERVGG
jgi:hypothetical protein